MNSNVNHPNKQEQVMVSVASERAEAVGGVLIAVFAALMAVSELVNNNIEEEKAIALNKSNSYFSWYQSKSIKQSLQENQLTTLETLIKAGLITSQKIDVINEEMSKLKGDIKRYKMEKKEILEGSSSLPQSEWAQDLNGEMGKIVGVHQWEAQTAKLEKATNQFDLAALFFQISLVLGAICIIIYDNPKLQNWFIRLMILCGLSGIGLAIYGYSLS